MQEYSFKTFVYSKVPNAMFIKPSQYADSTVTYTNLAPFPRQHCCRWHIWILSTVVSHYSDNSLILSSGWHEHRMKRTRISKSHVRLLDRTLRNITSTFLQLRARLEEPRSAMRYDFELLTKKTFCRLKYLRELPGDV